MNEQHTPQSTVLTLSFYGTQKKTPTTTSMLHAHASPLSYMQARLYATHITERNGSEPPVRALLAYPYGYPP